MDRRNRALAPLDLGLNLLIRWFFGLDLTFESFFVAVALPFDVLVLNLFMCGCFFSFVREQQHWLAYLLCDIFRYKHLRCIYYWCWSSSTVPTSMLVLVSEKQIMVPLAFAGPPSLKFSCRQLQPAGTVAQWCLTAQLHQHLFGTWRHFCLYIYNVFWNMHGSPNQVWAKVQYAYH